MATSAPPEHFEFTKVVDKKIRTFIASRNSRKHPFIWTKTADEILDKIDRKRKHVSTTRHWRTATAIDLGKCVLAEVF